MKFMVPSRAEAPELNSSQIVIMNVLEKTQKILEDANSHCDRRFEVEEDGWIDYRTRTRTARTRSPTESAETETGDGTVTVSSEGTQRLILECGRPAVRQEFGQNSYSWNRRKDRELGAPALAARPPANGTSPAMRAPHPSGCRWGFDTRRRAPDKGASGEESPNEKERARARIIEYPHLHADPRPVWWALNGRLTSFSRGPSKPTEEERGREERDGTRTQCGCLERRVVLRGILEGRTPTRLPPCALGAAAPGLSPALSPHGHSSSCGARTRGRKFMGFDARASVSRMYPPMKSAPAPTHPTSRDTSQEGAYSHTAGAYWASNLLPSSKIGVATRERGEGRREQREDAHIVAREEDGFERGVVRWASGEVRREKAREA
ncbi:hypothetical protein B0H13DRAFT_2459668 [Mycena leptocephala]|nr:hypothetical protein B0H13DRAFT_2459668 [Mycena leptocephala]